MHVSHGQNLNCSSHAVGVVVAAAAAGLQLLHRLLVHEDQGERLVQVVQSQLLLVQGIEFVVKKDPWFMKRVFQERLNVFKKMILQDTDERMERESLPHAPLPRSKYR